MAVDNSALVEQFCPEVEDGDTFIYTEMLDRAKQKGNNGQRLLKTFYHRSRAEFREQWPTIKQLCDMSCVRAYTRLAPRSFRKVGAVFTRLVVDAALTDNFAGMKSLYNRACGTVGPNRKLWLWDVDEMGIAAYALLASLTDRDVLMASIPSKKGIHYITVPFEALDLREAYPDIAVHKDNPTNLYIPDGAA